MTYLVDVTTFNLPDPKVISTDFDTGHSHYFFTAQEWFADSLIDIPEGLTAQIDVTFYEDGYGPYRGYDPIYTSSCTVTPDGSVHSDDE